MGAGPRRGARTPPRRRGGGRGSAWRDARPGGPADRRPVRARPARPPGRGPSPRTARRPGGPRLASRPPVWQARVRSLSRGMKRPTPRQIAAVALLLGAAACTRAHDEIAPPPEAGPTSRCLVDEPEATPRRLAQEADDALGRGDDERALACADEAIRILPRLVRALAARAEALGALDRIDEARLAWSRALAVDPSDPEALLGAAELHVRRLGPARDALEAGLEYALRGARAAAAKKDRTLAARLVLVAAMAENDLGRSQLALPHAERAVALLPDDADAAYERGVALYELCRFGEAEKAFGRALSLSPDDPWALHQLGLLAERKGDAARAAKLLARAHELSPDEFPKEVGV